MRCIPLATEGGASIWITRSTAPISIPSSSVDVAHKALTIEITGDESKVGAFLGLMEPFGTRDITRTGKVAMPRK